MFSKIVIPLVVVLLVGAAVADDLSGGNPGTNMELATGYKLQGATDHGLQSNGLGYGYVGSKFSTVSSENYPAEMNTYTAMSYFLSQFAPAGYFAAGATGAMAIWYLMSSFILPASRRIIHQIQDTTRHHLEEAEEETEEQIEKPGKNKSKNRRKRSTVVKKVRNDIDTLAAIVLNAVNSGECLQKTICLMGKQITDDKGKFAEVILVKLLPSYIQQSSYFLTLSRSMRGELSCERFRCNVS